MEDGDRKMLLPVAVGSAAMTTNSPNFSLFLHRGNFIFM
jgi:hypothetical protein